jgi:hypothetical protein
MQRAVRITSWTSPARAARSGGAVGRAVLLALGAGILEVVDGARPLARLFAEPRDDPERRVTGWETRVVAVHQLVEPVPVVGHGEKTLLRAVIGRVRDSYYSGRLI